METIILMIILTNFSRQKTDWKFELAFVNLWKMIKEHFVCVTTCSWVVIAGRYDKSCLFVRFFCFDYVCFWTTFVKEHLNGDRIDDTVHNLECLIWCEEIHLPLGWSLFLLFFCDRSCWNAIEMTFFWMAVDLATKIVHSVYDNFTDHECMA